MTFLYIPTRAKAKVGPMYTGHENLTMTTTIKDDSHRTPLNSTTKAKGVRTEKESLAIRRARVKAKVVERQGLSRRQKHK